MSAAICTRTLRTGTYWTIVLDLQQPAFEKNDRFGVSFNKLDSRWNQTVFLVVVGKCCTWAWGFGRFRPRVFNNFRLKKNVTSLRRSITLRADTRRLLHCYFPAALFTKKLRFGSYRTIVSYPKQPSFENIAALVFHSTNLITDGSFNGTKFFGSYRTRVSNTFRVREGNFFALFFNFESRCKNTVTLLIVDSHAHRALRFGTYRTVVLGLQLPL